VRNLTIFFKRMLFMMLLFGLLPGSANAQTLPAVNPSTVTGDILTGGSTVMVPMMQRVRDGFQLGGYTGNLVIEASDSTTAIQRFCAGELDIALMDRAVTEDEEALCASRGRVPISFLVAADAVVIAVSQSNTFVVNLTTEELRNTFGAAVSWSQVQPTWPNQPINRLFPGAGSPTFLAMAEAVFDGDARAMLTAIGARFDDNLDSQLVALRDNPYGIAVMPGYYVNRNLSELKVLAVNGVSPSADTVANGTYLMGQPLLLVSSANLLQQQPQVAAFVNFAISNTTPEATALGFYPVNLTQASNAWLTATGAQGAAAAPPPPPTAVATEEAVPPAADADTPVVVDPPAAEAAAPEAMSPGLTSDVQGTLASIRADLELLATTLYGNARPEAWSGSEDLNDPQLPLLIRLDLENLAGNQLGAETRPRGWFGVVRSTPFAIARDTRHDLELLADELLGLNARPEGWMGPLDPLMRCDRSTQTLVALLVRGGVYTPLTNPSTANYCQELANEITAFSEQVLLSEANDDAIFSPNAQIATGSASITTDFAVGFFDTNAQQRGGVIPNGTPVTPVARSASNFSNMMLVSGEGFTLFVEFTNTTVNREQFETLPTVDEINPATVCTTRWCR